MKLHRALDVAGLSDIGLQRRQNEDAIDFDASLGVMVLADGMGGHKAGEVASEIAVLSTLADLKFQLKKKFYFLSQFLKQSESHIIHQAVNRSNALIYNISQTKPQFSGMGTTLLVTVFSKKKLFVGHVGDSRLYRFRQQQLQQLTEDHSFVQAQINAGWMTLEDAKIAANKNLVTRALGLGEEVELSLNVFDIETEDIYLLCSDGLSDVLVDDEIALVLNQEKNLQKIAEDLIHSTLAQGGKDNVSVILVRVKKHFFEKEKNFILSINALLSHAYQKYVTHFFKA